MTAPTAPPASSSHQTRSNRPAVPDSGRTAGGDEQAPVQHEASALRMATFKLARRLRANRAVDTMSDAQFAVLAALTVHGPHTLGELADRERVSAPSMNRTVNCLEEAGYLTRTPDEHDRRKVNIDLTDHGVEVVDETVRRRDAWLERELSSLGADDRDVLARAATIMRGIAER